MGSEFADREGRRIRYHMNYETSFWSVPGSLLIAGEYIVTETKGPGLALSVDHRAALSVIGSENLVLEGSGPNTGQYWTPGSGDDGSLMYAVFDECRNSGLAAGNPTVSPSANLSVDTHRFYDSRGRKLGYGSSAAAAVLFTRGLLHTNDPVDLTTTALRAHRRWQKGRGSGYDVLSSIKGGAGIFHGGKVPEWTPLTWPSELKFWLIRGPAPVNSSDAVKKYRSWLNTQNSDWDSVPVLSGIRFEMQIIQNALNRGSLPDPSAILATINSLAEYGMQLGWEIDVPARPILPEAFSSIAAPWYRPGSAAAKCLGAGDEIVLLAALPDGLSRDEALALEMLIKEGTAQELKVDPVGLIQEASL